MKLVILRFLIGGIVVSVFSLIGDLLKPKSFAGLFGAAPSVALASLGIAVASEGAAFARVEARSMIAGAVAFFAYASFVSWMTMHYRVKALAATSYSLPLWLGTAFAFWYVCLK